MKPPAAPAPGSWERPPADGWPEPPVWFQPPPPPPEVPAPPKAPPPPTVELTIDGRTVAVPEGTTILEACRSLGLELPTLCYLETLTPVNVCRLCVVEVAGNRTLVPACSRRVEAGMAVRTDSPRVRLARKVVLEFLASSVDLSLAGPVEPDGSLGRWLEAYGADPGRFGPPAAAGAAGERDRRRAGDHEPTDGSQAATVGQPVKDDNPLYVRDYARCVLCYKCVEACGWDAQHTFAIAVAGRGFDARISTEWAVPLPESACVYCGNCIGVCPTGALMVRSEYLMRQAGTWDESRQTTTRTICPYCGVGCNLVVHVQDGRIVKVTSPSEHDVTRGHLCIKGRFGWSFTQGEDEEAAPSPLGRSAPGGYRG